MASEGGEASNARFNRLWGAINLAALVIAILLVVLSFATGWPGS